MAEKLRVLVADGEPAFREGLSRALDDEADLKVIAKSSDGEETVRLAKELVPDVVMVNIAMPNLDGIQATRQIKAACPSTIVLILSTRSYQSQMLACVRAGAAGYVLKSVPIGELISVVRLARSGEGVFELTVASKVLRRLVAEERGGRRGPKELNHREMEILKLAAKGLRNKEIATELSIGQRTVQSHMINIFGKLEVASRMEAVLSALKEGLITLDDLP